MGRSGLLLAGVLAIAACGNEPPQPAATGRPDPPRGARSGDSVLTLGDVDPDLPASKIESIEPLARFLEERLARHGVSDVRIAIARDIPDMAARLRSGGVDVYLDSVYPTLAVRRVAGSKLLGLTWFGEDFEYSSVLVAPRDGIATLEALRGRVVAFEEPHSTSGFFLPLLHLRDRGHRLERLSGLGAQPSSDAVGYVFSGAAENTIELVLRGQVAAGAVSDEDLDARSRSDVERLREIDRTFTVPRRLVSVRGDLEPSLVEALGEALVAIARDSPLPVPLAAGPRAWRWKFELLTDGSRAAIERLVPMLDAVE